ncbi:MAG TPA: dihydrolipoamide acetyltransferase family protein [Rubrobacter sp.]|nr:dihydrolipoamide acetyltransferase family protein [Rubrobacter sp.]
MPEVIMPKMGDAMEEGTLLQWLKSEGEEVSEGDPIAEIETDKVTLELEAEDAGTLAQLIASEGQEVPVGEAIAFIQGEGEEVPERSEGGGEVEEEAEEGGEEDSGGAQATATETEAPEEGEADVQADGRADGHFRASPIVRRLAEENDLDLSKIDGSGPAGRIVERDVRAAMESGTAQRTEDGVAAPEQPQQAEMRGFQPARLPEPTEEPGTQLVEPTRMMQVIGERMTEAKQHVPHFYATVEVRMDAAMALRKQLNAQLEDEGIKLSVNDFVMKACAVALRSYPNLNALYTTRGVELHEKVDMAMAVALDQGLITPVIRDIGSKGLAAISQESKDLATRAREGKLQPDEYQGGTITVSNMGMFGIESFTAIINPPQAAIVAVSSIAKRPDYDENGEIVPASMMKLTLSADHRIANGRDGALYMAEVKRILENPVMLMV